MRVMCMYLPQYHAFPENDEWWGKGYTEWVAVKRAKPLYNSHTQPKVPLDNRYYDLKSEAVATWTWQAELAKKYKVYGFSVYQYYFKGKMLMNSPLEVLREHTEIDIKYNICWANESWTRTWYGLSSQVLMAQEYGDEKDWHDHFDYLMKFFSDERYIKIDNKPVLQIYRSFDIKKLDEMLSCFNKWAKEKGFDGVYIVVGKTAADLEERKLADGYYYFEPGYTLKHDFSPINKLIYNASVFVKSTINKLIKDENKKILERSIAADKIYNAIEKREYAPNEYPGLIPDWDNTPRRSYKGLVYKGTSPEKFERVLRTLNDKIPDDGFVYVNAWNEWGEGAFLEPDTRRKYAYLEAISRVAGCN